MPAKWFICPDNGRIEIEECLKEGGCRMANRCATRSYLRFISQEREWTGKPSTTQLIAGTMLSYLRLTKEYAISPGDRAFMAHGSKVHRQIAYADDEFSLLEEKLDGPDTDVTGIFDVFEQEDGKSVLVDYKTSGSYKVAKALGIYVAEEESEEVYKSGPRKGQHKIIKYLNRSDDKIDRWEWELQLNKYRVELEKRGFKVDEMRIMCIVRDGNTWMARSRGVFRSVYYFLIPKISDDKINRYFKRKRRDLMKALKNGWTTPCGASENWDGIRCARYCEVAEFCPYGRYLHEIKEVEDMPIKRLSSIRRLPRLGTIALGEKKISKDGKEYPTEVDHFILKPQTPIEGERERLLRTFNHLFGEKPKSIRIMLPVGDMDTVFAQWYMRYGASHGLKCRGDGETATCMQEEYTTGLEVLGKEGDMFQVVCAGEDCIHYQSGECRRVATLQVLIPELPGAGVWQIRTGSRNSIINMNSCMDYILAMAGRFHMLPLTLERREQEITHDGKKRKHYILHINLDVELAKLQSYAQIDPTRILLELPATENGVEELLLEENPEEAIHQLPEADEVDFEVEVVDESDDDIIGKVAEACDLTVSDVTWYRDCGRFKSAPKALEAFKWLLEDVDGRRSSFLGSYMKQRNKEHNKDG